MTHNVLIVDDNQAFLNLIEKKFEKINDKFSVHISENGVKALELLKKRSFSIVISDLQMPQMDGYALLMHIKKNFPDISVIIITAFDKPKTQSVVLKSGASAYFTKPLVIEDLAVKVNELILSETDGGSLNNASLEMFIQLVEMEAKSCTIRVTDDSSGRKGILFFKEGELFSARYTNILGNKAAYKIFSWDRVSLDIQNNCMAHEKTIEGELQAILLDAMRLKDEEGYSEDDFDDDNKQNDDEAQPTESTDEPIELKESETSELLKSWEEGEEIPKTANVINSEPDFTSFVNEQNGLVSMATDMTQSAFVNQVKSFNALFNTGDLKACYIDTGRSEDIIIVPDDNGITVVNINPKCPREKILSGIKEL